MQGIISGSILLLLAVLVLFITLLLIMYIIEFDRRTSYYVRKTKI